MSRIFLSHSSLDARQAIALKQWLVAQEPPLANDIFLDIDPGPGIQTGTRWRDALRQASTRCEAVVCLLSANWERSHECRAEFRTAEYLNKQIFCARLEAGTGQDITSEWQRCDLFGEGPMTDIDIGDGEPVRLATAGLYRLRDGIRGAGIGAESFVWPPPAQPDRSPYRGWEPFEEADAAVFFGRDAQIVRALDVVRGMRLSGVRSLFVVLGPSGSGKSSFLRAGLLPRLRREDRRFLLLDTVRPERLPLTGDAGLAHAVFTTRERLGLGAPTLGEIKTICTNRPAQIGELLVEAQQVALSRLVERGDDTSLPSLVLPLDQAEELFSADSGPQAAQFLEILAGLLSSDDRAEGGLIVTATIRTDRYEAMQTHPAMAKIDTELFDELKPMPTTQFKEVITGPAMRAAESSKPVEFEPALVDQLLADCADGGDTLPILALTLARLYVDYGSSGRLTLGQYTSMEGMRSVVQTEVDKVLSSVPEERAAQLEVLRSAFIPWLATINPDNNQPMRRVARWEELPQAARPLIDQFVARRLMVRDSRDGVDIVEVALESLFGQWTELAGWLSDRRQDLVDADNLQRGASAWKANECDDAWLLEGARLASAESLARKEGFRERLSGTTEFLNASRLREDDRRDTEQRRQEAELETARKYAATLRKRSRVLQAVLAVTAIVAVIAAFGFWQADQASRRADERARESKTLRLVSDSQSMMSGLRPGSDSRAIAELLAAHVLAPPADQDSATAGEEAPGDLVDSGMLAALVDRSSLRKVTDTAEQVVAVGFGPDGPVAVTGADGRPVGLIDPQNGNKLGKPLQDRGDIMVTAISPDGRHVAIATGTSKITVYDARTGAVTTQPFDGGATFLAELAFNGDGSRIAAVTDDGSVLLWDNNGHQIWQAASEAEEDSGSTGGGAIAFDPVHPRLVTGSAGVLWQWDTNTGQRVSPPLIGHRGAVTAVGYSDDGTRIVSGSQDSTVRLWDADSGAEIGAPFTGHTDWVRSVALSHDGKTIASGSDDRTARLWDVGTNTWTTLAGNHDGVTSVAFSQDDSQVITGSADRSAAIWTTAVYGLGSAERNSHRSRDLEMLFSGLHLVALLKQNRLLAEALKEKGVTRPPTDEHLPAGNLVTSNTAFSPDGGTYVAGGQDAVVHVYSSVDDSRNGTQMQGHTEYVFGVAYSADGKRIVSGSADRTIRQWDAAARTPIGAPIPASDGAVVSVAYNRDATRIVSGDTDGLVRQWDAATGKPIGEPMKGHANDVLAVAYSPDGSIIASASMDKTIRLWDAATGKQIGDPMTGHAGGVLSLAFSRDGRRLASGGYDNTVRLWDAATRQPLGKPLIGHRQPVMSVAFTQADAEIVSTDDDGVLRRWPGPASWADTLCDKLATQMTVQQWHDWVLPDRDALPVCPRPKT